MSLTEFIKKYNDLQVGEHLEEVVTVAGEFTLIVFSIKFRWARQLFFLRVLFIKIITLKEYSIYIVLCPV